MPTSVSKRRVDRKPTDKAGWWSEKQRMDAVIQFLSHGNLMQVSRDMGIPEFTLRRWKGEAWWKEKEDEVRKMATTELSGRIGKLINKAVDTVAERIEHGDYYYNKKDGKIGRMGVRARDANQITKDMIDRKILLDKIAAKSETTEASIDQRLKNLQEEFLKFAKATEIQSLPVKAKDVTPAKEEPKVIDVVPKIL